MAESNAEVCGVCGRGIGNNSIQCTTSEVGIGNEVVLRVFFFRNHGTSTRCLVMSFIFCDHGPNCWALVVQSYTSWQCHPSTLYMACLFLFVPSTIPNISVFNFLLSSILHMWPNSQSFLWMALCSWSFSILSVSHISQFVFRPVQLIHRIFGNSASQMPAVCLWSFCCMSTFHSHIALCWTLLFSIYVFCVIGDVLTLQKSMDFVTSVDLLILVKEYPAA